MRMYRVISENGYTLIVRSSDILRAITSAEKLLYPVAIHKIDLLGEA